MNSKEKEKESTLKDAPKEIQLAVDLIELLETNEIDNQVAIKALKIVLSDVENKLNYTQTT
jgi:DNA-binding protein